MTVSQKGHFTLRKCVPSDVDVIAKTMRLHDVRECGMVGVRPRTALLVPFVEKGASGFTITHKDKPIAMCGVTPLDKYFRFGRIWFLGTDDIYKIQLSLFKYSEIVLAFLVKDYEMVENFVPFDHLTNLMWLEWMGFESEEQSYYINEYEFIRVFYCNSHKFQSNNILSERPVLH